MSNKDLKYTCKEYNNMSISQKNEYGKIEFTMIKGNHQGADIVSIPFSCFEVYGVQKVFFIDNILGELILSNIDREVKNGDFSNESIKLNEFQAQFLKSEYGLEIAYGFKIIG